MALARLNIQKDTQILFMSISSSGSGNKSYGASMGMQLTKILGKMDFPKFKIPFGWAVSLCPVMSLQSSMVLHVFVVVQFEGSSNGGWV